jgi:hypothetical protein
VIQRVEIICTASLLQKERARAKVKKGRGEVYKEIINWALVSLKTILLQLS